MATASPRGETGSDANKDCDPGVLEAAPISKGQAARMSYGAAAESREEIDDEGDQMLQPSEDGHYVHLDASRIACVVCVAIDHADSKFGEYNVLFTQQWVLQLLLVISGLCFAMSKRSCLMYQFRLGVYFCIGFMINLTAWEVRSLPWRKDLFNVVFQFWFVFGIMLCGVIFAPVKPYLAWASRGSCGGEPLLESPGRMWRTSRDSLVMNLVVLGGGLLGLMLLFDLCIEPAVVSCAPLVFRLCTTMGVNEATWDLPATLAETETFLTDTCTYALLTCSNVYLVIILPFYVKNTSLVPWAVLFNTYAHRALFYRAANERPWHCMDLFMIGMISYYFGLRHRRKIGEYVVRYWFVLILVAGLVWSPEIHYRLDMYPPTDGMLRKRNAILEFLFVTSWLVAGERLVRPEIFTVDGLGFLNEWALMLFLTHKAAYILLPPPWSYFTLLAMAPATYFAQKRRPLAEASDCGQQS